MKKFQAFLYTLLFSLNLFGHAYITSGGGGTPGGSNTQLQYNNSGSFGGISGATWNGTRVNIPNIEGLTAANANPFTVTCAMSTIIVPAGIASSVTLNLPKATDCPGKKFNFINGDGSGGTVFTVVPFAGDVIEGNFTGITVPYEGFNLINDNVDRWWNSPSDPSSLFVGNTVKDATEKCILYTDNNTGLYLKCDDSLEWDSGTNDLYVGGTSAVDDDVNIWFKDGASSSQIVMYGPAGSDSSFIGSHNGGPTSRISSPYYSFLAATNPGGDTLSTGAIGVNGLPTLIEWNQTGDMYFNGIKWPSADGTANQIIKTDGAGTLSFTDAFAVNANYLYDTAGTPVLSADGVNRQLKDSSAALSIDWTARNLYAPNGTTPLIDYSDTVGASASMSVLATKVSFFNDATYISSTGDITITGTATLSAAGVTASASASLPNIETSGSGIGFYGATQTGQITTAVTAATFVANTSGIADDTATWDGYTMGQVVAALRSYGLLQ